MANGVISRQEDVAQLAALPGTLHGATLSELKRALAASWSKETSYEPAAWTRSNSAWGQCAVTALIIQDFLGGDLIVGEVNGMVHYWNQIPGHKLLDLTVHQFGPEIKRRKAKKSDRAFVLSFPDTVRRYRKLRSAVLQKMDCENVWATAAS